MQHSLMTALAGDKLRNTLARLDTPGGGVFSLAPRGTSGERVGVRGCGTPR